MSTRPPGWPASGSDDHRTAVEVPVSSSTILITSDESRRDCPPRKVAWLAVSDVGLDPEGQLTDEELTALALAADPDAPIADGAVPIGIHLAQLGPALPLWYMPPAVRRGGRRWKAPFVIAVVSAFLLIDRHGPLQHLRDPRLGLACRHDRRTRIDSERPSRRRRSGLAGGDPALDPGVADPASRRHVRPGPEARLLVVVQLGVQRLLGRRTTRPGRTGTAPSATSVPFSMYGLSASRSLDALAALEIDLVGAPVEAQSARSRRRPRRRCHRSASQSRSLPWTDGGRALTVHKGRSARTRSWSTRCRK